MTVRVPVGTGSRTALAAALLAVAAILLLPGEAASMPLDRTRLTIQSWPEGLFGYVKSSDDRCAQGRRVAVFRQRGRRPKPPRDTRLATATARSAEGPAQWLAKTKRTGRFYAKAPATRRCRPDRSKVVRVAADETGAEAGAELPPCSPYVSEGGTEICRLQQIEYHCPGPSITAPSGVCSGDAVRGPFPWGASGSGRATPARFEWDHGKHSLLYISYDPPGRTTEVSYLSGTIPGPESASFHIDDGWARDDTGGSNGDHFRTPDLPGQAAGELGGPLHLNWTNSRGLNIVYIDGYLYLKR